MRTLFVFDYKDYKENGTVGIRPSVRGIIIKDGRIAMVHSRKYNYYAFPGGGIDPGEKKEETLIREIREELGLDVIPESIKEYGLVIRKEKGAIDDLFILENYYFLCQKERHRIVPSPVWERGLPFCVNPDGVAKANKNDFFLWRYGKSVYFCSAFGSPDSLSACLWS